VAVGSPRRVEGWSFVLTLQQIRRFSALAPAALASLVLAGAAVPDLVHAQGRLEAHYTVRLAGIPIGKGHWVIDISDTQYSAAASGETTGLMKIFTGGEGSGAARGTLEAGKPVLSDYAASIKTRKKTDETRLTVADGKVTEFKLDPPQGPDKERVPLTEETKRGVLDPMTAMLLSVPGAGNPLSPEACRRRLAVFDGKLRYDLQLAFKRMDQVKADKGYAGPVLVCAVYFVPVAGYVPSRAAVKYLSRARDLEVWLAPIAGTRVLVPFRAEGPTPIGTAVLEADQFVSVATPAVVPAKASVQKPAKKPIKRAVNEAAKEPAKEPAKLPAANGVKTP
jgi:hypothetical protein